MTISLELADAGLSLADMSAQLYAKGWMEGTAGNISVRLAGRDTALITASGISKGSLTVRDVVEVRVTDAGPVWTDGPKPSAETSIHAALYRLFPDCGAVVHAHPPYATAIAATSRGFTRFAGLEIIKGLGVPDPSAVTIPVFANWPDVTHIAADVEAALGPDSPPALLIHAHGATTWGSNVETARNRMECVEAMCRLRYLLDR
jgi:methylthioribose-1-phosphate isomerase/methylthioribulose-1-phosphate dehydratase